MNRKLTLKQIDQQANHAMQTSRNIIFMIVDKHFFYLCLDNEPGQVHYTEIEVNQLTDGNEGFLPPLHMNTMYSRVY